MTLFSLFSLFNPDIFSCSKCYKNSFKCNEIKILNLLTFRIILIIFIPVIIRINSGRKNPTVKRNMLYEKSSLDFHEGAQLMPLSSIANLELYINILQILSVA